MLREMLRDPNAKDQDARFRELLRAILAEHRFRPLSTADFQHAVEQHMTPAMDLEGTHRMDWFFDQWVRGTDLPRYSVKFEVKPRGNAFVVSGETRTVGNGRHVHSGGAALCGAGCGKTGKTGSGGDHRHGDALSV